MPDKPTTAEGYRGEHVARVRATCLYVATKLGDLMDDLVVVGGLVPSLLIDQEDLPAGAIAHVGTMDLDVGLTIALLDVNAEPGDFFPRPDDGRWVVDRRTAVLWFVCPPAVDR